MSQPLYQLAGEYQALLEIDTENEPNLIEAIANTLDGINTEFDDKAANVAAYRQTIKARSEMFAAEISRLQQRKKSYDNQAAGLADYLKSNMQALGKKKIEGGVFTITVTKPRPVANVVDATAIDDRFCKTERKINKADILKALKAGETVAGAELGESEAGLRIS